jgi:hypothetical protein
MIRGSTGRIFGLGLGIGFNLLLASGDAGLTSGDYCSVCSVLCRVECDDDSSSDQNVRGGARETEEPKFSWARLFRYNAFK